MHTSHDETTYDRTIPVITTKQPDLRTDQTTGTASKAFSVINSPPVIIKTLWHSNISNTVLKSLTIDEIASNP
ncbi:hypothetical protein V6N12_001138 [Hibiscus sabdariffa]|uniref:Uncharacterized protein n=1 Tax=Hibiscus sabdariffa TaxID=183260 RepID=A0ABR2C6C6_9ROSI